MKKITVGLSMVLFAVFAITSCEKEEVTKSESKTVAPVQKNLVANVSISAVTGSYCGTTWPCGVASVANTSSNSIVTTNNDQANYPSLVYTYYKYTGMSGGNEVYQPIANAQYMCDEYHPVLSNGTFTDNTKYMVIATDPAVPAPSMSTNVSYSPLIKKITYNPGGGRFDFERVTTGNYAGDVCGGPGSGDVPF